MQNKSKLYIKIQIWKGLFVKFDREAKPQEKIWHLEDNPGPPWTLSADIPASLKGLYLFKNPSINFQLARKPLRVDLMVHAYLRPAFSCHHYWTLQNECVFPLY